MSFMNERAALLRCLKILSTILPLLLVTLILTRVPQAGSKPDTTMIIDDNPSDWDAVIPIARDPSGDGGANYDLQECYVTNDGSNLYFMIKVQGEIQHAGEGGDIQYGVGLDTDQNRNTGEEEGPQNVKLDIGFDYAIVGPFYKSEIDRYLFNILKAPADGEVEGELVGAFISSFSNGVLEFGCPLSTIGYPNAIDMIFVGKPFAADLDFAPDQTNGQKDYVTYRVAPPLIKADGKIDDWVGVSPLAEISDPPGDANGDDEDILYCYVTNDGETLYARIDIKGDVTATGCLVGLDTDTNPDTGLSEFDGLLLGIGVDYFAYTPLTEYAGSLGVLFSPPSIGGAPPIINAVSSGRVGQIVEFAIPLRWIGNPGYIDIVFIASILQQAGTDVAGPLRYKVYTQAPPPKLPSYPVGGALIPANKFVILSPYVGLIAMAALAAAAVKRRKH